MILIKSINFIFLKHLIMENYRIEIVVSFLKILIPLIPITFISVFFIKILRIDDKLEKIILIFLINWIQILISVQLFSLFKLVSFWPLLIFYLPSSLICLLISIKKKINFRINFGNIWIFLKKFFDNLELNKILKIILITWFILILFITFLIGVNHPPVNYDSMTYHLARAAFWNQYQALNHYNTWAAIQNENPINGEIGLLWIILFTNSDTLTFLVQWICFLVILIALYKLLRFLNFSRIASILTVFVFSTLDIVLLESNSTQNDLVIACFAIITLYFFIKVIKDNKIDIKYIVFAGFAAGITIGTKGYSYLLIPGFLLLVILFGKNSKLKLIKLSYLLLFSLVGIILFSLYNFVQNYIYYQNIFSSADTSNIMRITSPNLKTFISNFERHLISFYQFYEKDFGTIGVQIQKYTNILHNKISLEISSPQTTLPGTIFSFSNLKTNFDESYFGPIYFFLVLPSLLYNLILFLAFRAWLFGKDVSEKFKSYLIILIIPVIFFISYTLIFKWQPFTGRLMITFVLFTMIGLTLFIDLLKLIKWKYFLQIFAAILIILTIWSSIRPMFKNDYYPISNLKFSSIFNFKDSEKKEQISGEDKISIMLRANELVDLKLGPRSRLGIAFDMSDWAYIFFGENLERNVQYINKDDWENKDIYTILKDNNLDGLLVNTKITDTLKVKSVYSKMLGENIIKVDSINFNNYFKPLNECKFFNLENKILVKVSGNDPYFESTFPFKISEYQSAILLIQIVVPKETFMQIYYKLEDKSYNENNSTIIKLQKGENEIYIPLYDASIIEKIRIDPVVTQIDCEINRIELYKFSNIRNIKEGNYILFY